MTPRNRICTAIIAAGLAVATMALTQAMPQAPRLAGRGNDVSRAVTGAAAGMTGDIRMALPRLRPVAEDGGEDMPADGAKLRVGARIDPTRLHPVTRPGLYGVGQSPPGSSYGIIAGRLIRYDPDSLRIQSIIREIEAVLD